MITQTYSDVAARIDIHQKSRAYVELQRGLMLKSINRVANPVEFAQSRIRGASERDLIAKAAVPAVTTADVGGAAPASILSNAFLELVRVVELVSMLVAFGRRTAPFNERFPIVTEGGTAQWTGEGLPVPVAHLALSLSLLQTTKIGTIVGFPFELVESLSPVAGQLIERDLVRAVRDMSNEVLLSDAAAVAGVSPAGLLAGLSPLGGGGSPASITDDLVDLWTAVRGGDIESPVFIASKRGGAYLASLRGSDGAPMFPGAGPLGGSIWGVALLTAHSAANHLILLDASALAVADGGIEMRTSTEAAVQMDSAPTAGAQIVSAWQTDTAFLRVIRLLNWELGYADAVGFIDLAFAGSPS